MSKDKITVNMNIYDIPILVEELEKEQKEIEKAYKEIERLNNIIDEIKNMCKEEYYKKNTTDIDSIGLSNNIWVMIYMKINELKGENK